ncbi:sigma-70 family RNA polymerase sigma factor [Cryptosporangium minutisporangium]|uniref:Sigma-70 family RNA polymerase sigma factor n=1 Tax=Cryptosporangium minutisporangium TaxID=113569 RepID=A0ABP6SRU8_9ACTN
MAGMSQFETETEPFRRELLAHCYRMLGSVAEAEDTVQETYLRAWRAFDHFEGRSSVRTWLYRIATNACLTALEHRRRRALPSHLGGPSADPSAAARADDSVSWLEPMPDALVKPLSGDPAEVVVARQSLRLALVASLQHLPARQRAVLLLRDVLAFPAAEVAEILTTTVPAVKSYLQRARAKLDDVAPAEEDFQEPADPRQRVLLDRYVRAIETVDVQALRELLHEDLVLEATPGRTWHAGVSVCLPFLQRQVLDAGRWRMLATAANGQPAAISYLRDDTGSYRAFGVIVLTTTATAISRINAFGDADLVAAFGFPQVLPTEEEDDVAEPTC